MMTADLDVVHAIDVLSFSSPWSRMSYENELVMNDYARCYVAEWEGGLVAAFVGWLIVDELHVATISVHPDHRRKGIARRLMETALADAAARGAISAALEVRAGNEAALALYEAFGFKIVGARPHYYPDNGEEALLMTLPKIGIRSLGIRN